MTSLVYKREIDYLNRKKPLTLRVGFQWEEKTSMEQIISSSLSASDATEVCNKFKEIFKAKKTGDVQALLQSLPNLIKVFTPQRNPNQSRAIISVPLLLEFFGDEMVDWSGGGGRKLNQNRAPELRVPGAGGRR